jgi:hypothetical protein
VFSKLAEAGGKNVSGVRRREGKLKNHAELLAFWGMAVYNKSRKSPIDKRNKPILAKLSKGSGAKPMGLKSFRIMIARPPKVFHHIVMVSSVQWFGQDFFISLFSANSAARIFQIDYFLS